MSDSVPEQDRAAALKLWIVLNRAQSAIGKHARRHLECAKISPREFAVLELLHAKGPRPLGEIGDGVLLTSGSTTYVIDRLAERGLIERRQCKEDQRITFAALTADGQQLIERILPDHLDAIRKAMGALSCDEKKECTELLKRLGKGAAGIPAE